MGTVLEETVLYIWMGWPNPVAEAEYRAIMYVIGSLCARRRCAPAWLLTGNMTAASVSVGRPRSSRLVFKENSTAVLERYPPIEGDQRPQMWNLGTDYVFTCPDRYAALTLARVVRFAKDSTPCADVALPWSRV